MKVAHLDAEPKLTGTVRELLDDAKRYEAEQVFEKAVKLYQAVIRKDHKNETAYNRLMIVLRKLKNYSEESRLIDQAIVAFEADDKVDKKQGAANIEKLSLSLGKLTGLIDKKGKSLYDPEPIATWKKRKLMVQKRLKPKTKTKKSGTSSPAKNKSLRSSKSSSPKSLLPDRRSSKNADLATPSLKGLLAQSLSPKASAKTNSKLRNEGSKKNQISKTKKK